MQLTCPTTLGHENWLNARDMPWEKLIDRRTSNTFQISEGLPRVGLAYTEAKFGNQKNNNRVQGSPKIMKKIYREHLNRHIPQKINEFLWLALARRYP